MSESKTSVKVNTYTELNVSLINLGNRLTSKVLRSLPAILAGEEDLKLG